MYWLPDDTSWTYLSGKRDQMVLAKAKDFNVFDNDQLIVILMEHGAINNVSQVLLVTLGKVHHSFCVTLGRTVEPLPLGVLANAFEECANCSREFLLTSGSLFGGRFESLASASAYDMVRNMTLRDMDQIILGQLRPSKSMVGAWVYGLLARLVCCDQSSRGSLASTSSRFATLEGRLSRGCACIWGWK